MKSRLDLALVEHGLATSREQARGHIMSGNVYVNGQKEDKPGFFVRETDNIECRAETLPYVSRGGLKLEKALRVFGLDVTDKTVLDAGASTGGFTDCLLQNGARHVIAVDVGYGQLAWSLRNDPRVTSMERTNIRLLTPETLPQPFDLATADLAFISLTKVLPVLKTLSPAPVVCLIKPQFEVGRELVGKKGVVRDPAVHLDLLQTFCTQSAPKCGFSVRKMDFSPIKGPQGNIEFLALLHPETGESSLPDDDIDIEKIVAQAHKEAGT